MDYLNVETLALKEIYIYGAGRRGALLAAYIMDMKQLPLKGIVVSDGYKSEPYCYFGSHKYKIFEVSEIADTVSDQTVFINTLITSRETVSNALNSRFPATCCVALTDDMYDQIQAELHRVNWGQLMISDFYTANTQDFSFAERPLYALNPMSADSLDIQSPLYDIFMDNTEKNIHKVHHYFPIYERYFSGFRNTKVKVVEVGVFKGGSLKMWKRYFGPHAEIHGIDIDPECARYEDPDNNIYVHIGSQSDEDFLNNTMDKIGDVNIFIDDGGHTTKQQITTFLCCYEKLSSNGVYLCEDLCTNLWLEYIDSGENFIDFAKKHIDLLYLFWGKIPSQSLM